MFVFMSITLFETVVMANKKKKRPLLDYILQVEQILNQMS